MAEVEDQGTLEKKSDAGKGPEGEVKFWLIEMELANKYEPFKEWLEEAGKIDERYQGKNILSLAFNILWSNYEVMKSAVYSNAPLADVRPRYPNDKGDAVSEASEILKRTLDFGTDAHDLNEEVMKPARYDYLVPGRAISRVRYEADMEEARERRPVNLEEPPEGGEPRAPSEVEIDGSKLPVESDNNGFFAQVPFERKKEERVFAEQVNWRDFRTGAGTSWNKVNWIGFIHRYTRKQLIELSPQHGSQVTLDWRPKGISEDTAKEQPDAFKKAIVWEIWDRKAKKVRWIAPSYKTAELKVEEDPLNLADFYPVPRPLRMGDNTGTLVPVPSFRMIRALADELDQYTIRIAKIAKAMRVKAIYDPAWGELQSLLNVDDDNVFVPAQNAAIAMQNGGIDRGIWTMDLTQLANVLRTLVELRENVKIQIFEIMGVSDILRGSSDPNETLGAQDIKAQAGAVRLNDSRDEMARYGKDIFNLQAELIAENFSEKTLLAMTGIEPTQDVMAILRNDGPRRFRIDIETNSTVALNEQAEQKRMADMMNAIGTLIRAVGPLLQTGTLDRRRFDTLLDGIVKRMGLGPRVEAVFDVPEEGPEGAGEGQGGPQGQGGEEGAQGEEQARQDAMAAREAQANLELEERKLAQERELKIMEIESKAETERYKTDVNAETQRMKFRSENRAGVLEESVS